MSLIKREVSDVRIPVAVKTATAVIVAIVCSTWLISSKFSGIELAAASAVQTSSEVRSEIAQIRNEVATIRRDNMRRTCLQEELNDWQIRGIKRSAGYCG